MNKTSPNRFLHSFVVIALLCGCAAVVLPSCSKKPGQAIIGKWDVQGESASVEFREDGTLAATEKGGSTDTGKYKFTDDTHMQMEMNDDANHTTTILWEISIHGDMADVTMTMPGDEKSKQTAHLKRIK
jgi:hypothetical protein